MKIELVHDKLAEAIYDRVAIEKKQLQEVYALIDARFHDFQLHKEMLLGAGELKFIDSFLVDLELSTPKRTFIEKSRLHLKQQKRRLRIRNYAIIVLATAVIFFPIVIWGLQMAMDAQSKELAAKEEVMRNKEALLKVENENDVLRRVLTGDSLPKIVAMRDLKADDYQNIRRIDMTYATIHLKGKVLNEAGHVVPGAKVNLMGAELQTNRRGDFECYFVVPPILRAKSSFYIEVEKATYQPLRQKVKIEGELELKLILKK